MCIRDRINIGGEESKGGIAPSELIETAKAVSGLENVRIRAVSYTHLDVYKRQDRERGCQVPCPSLFGSFPR